MGSCRALALSVISLSVGLVGNATAQGPPGTAQPATRIFPVWAIPAGWIDVQDHSVTDWEDITTEPSMTLIDFEGLRGIGYDPESLADRTFLGWSAEKQRTYFAIERIDDVYINAYDGTGPSSMIKHDHAGIWIDGDYSGGIYTSLPSDGLSTDEVAEFDSQQAQAYIAIAESPDGQLIHVSNERKDWTAHPPWADVDGFQAGDSPSYSLIEGYLTPWDTLMNSGSDASQRTLLEAGNIMGFNIALWDYDRGLGDSLADVYSAHADDFGWRDADRLAMGILLPLGAQSSVTPDSWGRIKATLR